MIHMDLQQWSNVRTSFVCFIFLLGFLVLVLYSSVLCLLLLKVIFVIIRQKYEKHKKKSKKMYLYWSYINTLLRFCSVQGFFVS